MPNKTASSVYLRGYQQKSDMASKQVFTPSYERVVVVGAGVLGLTTATSLQQRLPRNTKITIIANEFPYQSPMTAKRASQPSAAYASMWAGAHYRPIPYLSPTSPAYHSLDHAQQTFQSQLAYEHRLGTRTAQIMKELARSRPESGVQIVPAAEYLESPPPENVALKTGDVYASVDDSFCVFSDAQLAVLNSKSDNGTVKWTCEYETYVVNVHVYCQYLLQQFSERGGITIQRNLSSLADISTVLSNTQSPSQSQNSLLIVNCSGIGLPETPDQDMKVIRGQTVLVRQNFDRTLTRQCADGTWSFLIPRPLSGGTIVGGTKQIGDLETAARSEERKILLENASKYFPQFVSRPQDFDVVCDNVGRRPWRQGGLRIQAEELTECAEFGRTTVIHLYGAGGRGYELSWGAAEEVMQLTGIPDLACAKL